MTEPVARIAKDLHFIRRIATILLVGCVLAGGAFGAREYFHAKEARQAAQAACLDDAWHTGDPDKIEVALRDC